MRAFLASTLPVSLRDALAGQIEELTNCVPDRSVRWVEPGNIHLTLKFLGEISPERAQLVVDAARPVAARTQPFDLEASGVGLFPNPRRPTVIWVGVSGPDSRLSTLQVELEGALASVGFEAERRAFHPHLTLGRARRGLASSAQAALADGLSCVEVGSLGRWRVGGLTLMRSELRPDGPRYSQVASMALGSEADD